MKIDKIEISDRGFVTRKIVFETSNKSYPVSLIKDFIEKGQVDGYDSFFFTFSSTNDSMKLYLWKDAE